MTDQPQLKRASRKPSPVHNSTTVPSLGAVLKGCHGGLNLGVIFAPMIPE